MVQFPEGVGGDKIIEQTFKGPLHEHFYDDAVDRNEDPKKDPKKDPVDTSDLTTERKVYEMIKNNPEIRRKDIAELLEMSMGGIKKAIKRLSDRGVLHYEGYSKNGRWVIDKPL